MVQFAAGLVLSIATIQPGVFAGETDLIEAGMPAFSRAWFAGDYIKAAEGLASRARFPYLFSRTRRVGCFSSG